MDDYAVSPDGSQIAVVVYSGDPRFGGAEVRLYRDGAWDPVPLPFDMNSARVRFLDDQRLQVVAFEDPGPTKLSTRFIIDVRDHTVSEKETWPGEVVDYVAFGDRAIIAKARQRENRYDLFWANDTAITEYRFWDLRDLAIVGDTLYFYKASFIKREGTHDPFRAEDNPGHEVRILKMNLTTQRVEFVITAEQADAAGVRHMLQQICPDGHRLYMGDGSAGTPGRALYSYEPSTRALERVADLPPGSVAPCVRGPNVYFIKVTGSHRMPEELWRMSLQGDELVKFAP